MTAFKDFADKKLAFQTRVTYRCLYVDDATAPAMLVFDKTVKRGDVMSLLGVMGREDEAGAKALAAKKGKLKVGAITTDGKRHTLTFADEVNLSNAKARLKNLNPKIASKLDIVVQTEDEKVKPVTSKSVSDTESVSSSLSKSVSKSLSDSDDSVTVDAPLDASDDLVKAEKALETWRVTYGDPPAPGAPPQALVDATEVRELAEGYLDELATDADKTLAARAREVIEAIRVLAARVELQSRTPAYNGVYVTPLLAWAWCKSNIGRGKLKDELEKTLVPFERAVQAFHRAPSADGLKAASEARLKIETMLGVAIQHYTKKGGDDTKLRVAKDLLKAAQAQGRVLAGLAGQLGDLDPATCAKRGVDKLRTVVPEKDAAAKALELELANLEDRSKQAREQFLKSLGVDQPAKIQEAYEKAVRVADEDLGLSESERNEAKATALRERDKLLKTVKLRLESSLAGLPEGLETGRKRAVRDHALKGLEWTAVAPLLTPKLPLHVALGKVLPAYNASRDELAKGATSARLAATWKAFGVLNKAFDKAHEESGKLADGDDADKKRDAAKDNQLADRLKKRLAEEKLLLEAVEGELPQGKLASSLAATEDGRSTLDAWVAELGGKAVSEDDKAMVRTALKARFNVKRLDGDMTTKALPKLYKIMSLVPERQTRDNDKLNRIVRNQGKPVPDGFYNWDEDTKDGVMSMDMPRTGASGLMKKVFGQILPIVESPPGGWKDSGVKKSNAQIIFQHLTLHEVGHAVDEQLGFMDARVGNASYGDWRESSAEEVLDVACDTLGFADALDGVKPKKGAPPLTAPQHLGNDATQRKDFLKKYLTEVQSKRDPAKAAELIKLAEGFDVDWKALAAHPAVVFLKATKLNPGTVAQVTQWNEKAKSALAGGRVYQEAYEDTWWSYDVGARERGVGGYQFRAPGEWFAEIYASYYGGRLKSSHPDYAWLKALVDTQA